MSDQPQPKPFFLVVVAEGEPAAWTQFAARDELVAYLRDQFRPEAGVRVQVFIFQGERLHITPGDSKFLLQEGEQPVPLFHPPSPSPVPVETGDWFDVPDDDGQPGYTAYPGHPSASGLGDDPDA